MTKRKRIITILMIILMVMGSINSFGTINVSAKKWTKKLIQSEINKTKPQLSAAKKKYNDAKKKHKKETKGTHLLLFSRIISSDPLVVYDSIGRSYYWIDSGKKNLSIVYLTGWVNGTIKVTGETKQYGYYTCAVAKGVKVSSDLNKATKKYQSINKKYKDLKNALKDTPYLNFMDSNDYDPDNDELNVYLGENIKLKKYLSFKKNTDKYSKTNISYSSSNNKIARINKNGVLLTNGEGNVTITVKSNISGKKSKNKIYVMNDFSVNDTRNIYKEVDGYEEQGYIRLKVGETDQLTYSFKSDKSNPTMLFSSEDPSIASVDAEGNITAHRSGLVDIKMETEYVYAKIAVFVE